VSRWGCFQPTPPEVKEQRRKLRAEETLSVDLLHRAAPTRQTPDGLRALSKDRPINPESVERYLEGKFGEALGEALGDAEEAMTQLARSLPLSELTLRGYELYNAFRPEIPPGKKGWGAAGRLDLDRIRALADSPSRSARPAHPVERTRLTGASGRKYFAVIASLWESHRVRHEQSHRVSRPRGGAPNHRKWESCPTQASGERG
jgi:hypothetical protein